MYPLSYLSGLKKFKDGAWFEPSTVEQIRDADKLLALTSKDRVAELGAGDGVAVKELGRSGAQVVGFEKDEKLYLNFNGSKNSKIICADFWNQDLSQFNKIYVYQFKTVMPRLEKKLLSELPIGALVASNTWQFPHWKPVRTVGDIHLYCKV